MAPRVRTALMLLLVSLLLAACGGGVLPVEETPEGTPTPRPLFSSDFEEVCRRGRVERAPAYPDEGEIHPVMFFRREPNSESFYEMSTLELPVPWMADYERGYEEVELVVCMVATDSNFVEVCEYEDDESDDIFLLNMYDTTYEVTLYTAHSGEELDTMTLELTYDGDCPMFAFFSEEEEDQYMFPTAGDLEAFLEPYVEP